MISKVQLLKSTFDNHPSVRFLQRKLNLDGCRYDQLSCNDDFDDFSEDKRPRQQEKRFQSKTWLLNKPWYNQYSKLSCNENSNPVLENKKPVQQSTTPGQQSNVKAGKQKETVQKQAQQVRAGQKSVQQGNTIQNQAQWGQTSVANVHRSLCYTPSWQEDQKARDKFVQRRTAVCDNIERQLMNDHGISLRKLRKCMVVENVLKEVSLL